SRLSGRSRIWAELVLSFGGLGMAGFFLYQFVTSFTATPSLDQVAAGNGAPDLKNVWIAGLSVGVLVVYFSLTKAISMVRPGPTEAENPEYIDVAAQVSVAAQEISKAQAEAAAHEPRL